MKTKTTRLFLPNPPKTGGDGYHESDRANLKLARETGEPQVLGWMEYGGKGHLFLALPSNQIVVEVSD